MSSSTKQSEGIAYYGSRYDVVANFPLHADRTFWISDQADGRPRQCRFCRRAAPEVSFDRVAHAVPEFLGNKSILSQNECDVCNPFLANQYEDHLAKWFGASRTISQISGKQGVPTYQDKKREHGGRVRIEMRQHVPHVDVALPELPVSVREGDPIAFDLPLELPSQPHRPIRAAMALVKIACSICPVAEFQQCTGAVDWLMGRLQARTSNFPVIYGFTSGPNPDAPGRVMLLRRKVDEPIPHLWCIVATANHKFQFYVPFCDKDKRYNGDTFQAVPFDDEWPHGNTEFNLFNWSGEEPVVRAERAVLHIDRLELMKGPGVK
jgi:HNH endonuclease